MLLSNLKAGDYFECFASAWIVLSIQSLKEREKVSVTLLNIFNAKIRITILNPNWPLTPEEIDINNVQF